MGESRLWPLNTSFTDSQCGSGPPHRCLWASSLSLTGQNPFLTQQRWVLQSQADLHVCTLIYPSSPQGEADPEGDAGDRPSCSCEWCSQTSSSWPTWDLCRGQGDSQVGTRGRDCVLFRNPHSPNQTSRAGRPVQPHGLLGKHLLTCIRCIKNLWLDC